MHSRSLFAWLLFAPLCLNGQGAILLKHANVIDGFSDKPVRDATVSIENGRITSLSSVMMPQQIRDRLAQPGVRFRHALGKLRLQPALQLLHHRAAALLMKSQPPWLCQAKLARFGLVAIDSIVSSGCIISGGRVSRSVLSPGVRVNSYSEVDSSILMANVQIGRHSRIRRAIVPPNAVIPEFSVIGHDLNEDRAKGYTITESGVVVVTPPDVGGTVRAMTA